MVRLPIIEALAMHRGIRRLGRADSVQPCQMRRGYGVLDEVYLRTEIERVRRLGYAARNSGVLEGMAGVAVPILDRTGYAVAALSVGTLASRLGDDRLPMVVELLKRQADSIGPLTNSFDVALKRRPAQGLAPMAGGERIA